MPAEHPLRRVLADEVHARPPVAVPCPGEVSCLALLDASVAGRDQPAPLEQLAASAGMALPPHDRAHAVVELPAVRIKWERHSEFSSYLFVRPGDQREALSPAYPAALDAVPAGWLSNLPGQLIAAVDIEILPGPVPSPIPGIGAHLVGSKVAGGAAQAFTDFTLGPTGRERWRVYDLGLTDGQRARVVQRLAEIGVYRVMALLAFPMARELSAKLSVAENRLADVTAKLAELSAAGGTRPGAAVQERVMFDELTQLSAEIERSAAATSFRFAAAQAYWDLVNNRVADLREERIPGIATAGEFLSRRLAPALNTVFATARRQQAIAERIARASALLRTRVDLTREDQNQRLLAAMDRRGKLSLRLQETVEGLSVVAITYYAIGLLSHITPALQHLWPKLDPELVTAAGVPIFAFLIWRAVDRVRRELMKEA